MEKMLKMLDAMRTQVRRVMTLTHEGKTEDEIIGVVLAEMMRESLQDILKTGGLEGLLSMAGELGAQVMRVEPASGAAFNTLAQKPGVLRRAGFSLVALAEGACIPVGLHDHDIVVVIGKGEDRPYLTTAYRAAWQQIEQFRLADAREREVFAQGYGLHTRGDLMPENTSRDTRVDVWFNTQRAVWNVAAEDVDWQDVVHYRLATQ
jgi:hypothetical protein